MNLDKLFVALDYSNILDAHKFVETYPQINNYKIGLELFTVGGISYIQVLKQLGKKIFLDLKLFDIPNTLVRTCTILNKYNIDFLSVFAKVGPESIKQIQKVYKGQIFLVSDLTSSNDTSTILNTALIAKELNVGLICAGTDLRNVLSLTSGLVTACPGLSLDGVIDQKRVCTPYYAILNGANYLIMGRSITRSDDVEVILNYISNLMPNY